jgi:hypothetical protein
MTSCGALFQGVDEFFLIRILQECDVLLAIAGQHIGILFEFRSHTDASHSQRCSRATRCARTEGVGTGDADGFGGTCVACRCRCPHQAPSRHHTAEIASWGAAGCPAIGAVGGRIKRATSTRGTRPASGAPSEKGRKRRAKPILFIWHVLRLSVGLQSRAVHTHKIGAHGLCIDRYTGHAQTGQKAST